MRVTFIDLGADIASSRLRAAIPQRELEKLGIERGFDVVVYGKHVVPMHIVKRFKKAVYDVCDDHYSDMFAHYYLEHTECADLVTCNSETMRNIIKECTGRNAVVIPDPYESEEREAGIGSGFFWFGHQTNLHTIEPYLDLGVSVLTGDEWSREKQLAGIQRCAAVLLPTGTKLAKSANRLIETVRNGRFCICGPLPAYEEFSKWMWVGDIREGVEWFKSHQDEVIPRIKECQDYIRDRYSPETIARKWLEALEKLV